MKATLVLDRFGSDARPPLHREEPSRSLLFNLVKILYVFFSNLTYDITDHAGVDINVATHHTDPCGILALAAGTGRSMSWYPQGHTFTQSIRLNNQRCRSDYVGIVVGTGMNPVTLADLNLQAHVEHGRGAGELEYGGCFAARPPEVIHPDARLTVSRLFTNNSGAAITINEVGLQAVIVQAYTHDHSIASPALIARDLVSPGLDVDDGEILRASYQIETTV